MRNTATKPWQAVAMMAAAVALAVVAVVGVGLWMWPTVAGVAPDDGPSPAMNECMGTCMAWRLVGSLYRRGFCVGCEGLAACEGQKEAPTTGCLDALKACYAEQGCVAASRVDCDERCSVFVASMRPGAVF